MHFFDIDPDKIIQQKFAAALGLDKYSYIMENVNKIDISENEIFQKTFNSFYIVRRNEEWRKAYYHLFEESKKSLPTFGDTLYQLYDATGNVEASFSSKMIATLNPQMPIWDKYVVQNLKIKVPQYGDVKRMDTIIMQYQQIITWYEDFLESEKAHECITKFDEVFPDYRWISDVKKVDFFLWSIR